MSTKKSAAQPMQPCHLAKGGIVRFKSNALVRYLLYHGDIDMNALSVIEFPDEDREQFAQLIGYSIGGYHELPYVSDESAKKASRMARKIRPKLYGCRDRGCAIHTQ